MGNKQSVGRRLVSGLTGFANDLKSNRDSIPAKYTCRRVKLRLRPTAYSEGDVRMTRDLLGVSQAIFGEFLGVSVKTVQAWEQGINQPQRSACRFMDEIRHNPNYWRGRIEELWMETT